MYELPTSVTINGQSFTIRNNGDFRVVLDCFVALNDADLDEQDRVLAALIIFYEDIKEINDLDKIPDLKVAVTEMYKFFNGGTESIAGKQQYKLMDWETDATLIFAAINNVANREVRAESYLHWWTFMGYYISIGESTLSNVVSIRHKIIKGKKLEKYEQEFRQENPQYFNWNSKSVEDKEAENYIMSIWNKNNE